MEHSSKIKQIFPEKALRTILVVSLIGSIGLATAESILRGQNSFTRKAIELSLKRAEYTFSEKLVTEIMGEARESLVFRSTLPSSKYAIVLHGGWSSNEDSVLGPWAPMRNINEALLSNGYNTVWPNGTEDVFAKGSGRRFWNAGPAFAPVVGEADDIEYINTLIKQISDQDPQFNPEELVIIGYSNGGMMVHRLVADNFGINPKAVVMINASQEVPLVNPVAANMLLIANLDDNVVPYYGGNTEKSRVPRVVMPFDQAYRLRVEANNGSGKITKSIVYPEGGHSINPNVPAEIVEFINSLN